MSIPRRLRFEILRRDQHRCRYCGATAPDVKLAVDHVIPEVLGGTNDPTNLVTACEPCNSGKASISPDAHHVADVTATALRWGAALRLAAQQQQHDREAEQAQLRAFHDEWMSWTYTTSTGERAPIGELPYDWEPSVARWLRAGLTVDDFDFVIRATMLGPATRSNLFRYLAGVVRNTLEERFRLAQQIIDEEHP